MSLVNAQTLIAGKVYDSDFDVLVPDVTVTVTCGDSSLTTKTLDDGTYAVRFGNSTCSLGDIVDVSAKKGALTGGDDGEVSECGDDCDDDYFSIVNLNVNSGVVSSGGGGRGDSGNIQPILWFICGNDFCDNGETEETCRRDCYTEPVLKTIETQGTPENVIENVTDNAEENAPGSNIWGGITGAVIVAGNYMDIPILAAILAFMIIFLIGHKMIQRRKKKIRL